MAVGIASSRRARSVINRYPFTVHHSTILLTAALGPLLLILLLSLWTPLYHVRYLFTYSPAWSILLAMGITALGRRETRLSNALALTSLILLLAGSAVALRSFWNDPAFTADDHRAAVRELAQRWRPGDVILVNAGYTYTALLTYWPGPIAWHGRLTDYAQDEAQQAAAERDVVILQTGHVEGDPGIGWGDPRSDFYALPLDAIQTALRDLSAQTDRLWHYRIYDTVNDPQGVIRNALAAGWTLIDDRVYSGEANLRVQGWQGMHAALSSYLPPTVGSWGDWLAIAVPPDAVPGQVEAGGTIDIPGVQWRLLPNRPGYRVNLSLQLSDSNGEVWATHDEPLGGNQQDLRDLPAMIQPLRLEVPLGTAPGEYKLNAVIYDPGEGKVVNPDGPPTMGDHVPLGIITVTRPAETPAIQSAVADFGPLRLVEATSPVTAIPPGAGAPVELLWQAAPGFVPEPLVVVVQLLDQQGQVTASLEAEPLAGRYSAAQWQPGELVRDRHMLPVPDGVAPGRYQLIVGLYRAADGQRLTAISGLLGLTQRDHFLVRELEVR